MVPGNREIQKSSLFLLVKSNVSPLNVLAHVRSNFGRLYITLMIL